MYPFEADASIHTGKFLLPNTQYTDALWPVVACDQYTSQPEYWEAIDKAVSDHPSTLRLILPECWLSQAKERVPAIHETMRKYKNSNVFSREIEGLILIRRTIAAGERWGVLITVDLERYDFAPDSHSLIRPTEGTITDRIPPRLAVRAEAPLELSHILLFMGHGLYGNIQPVIPLNRFSFLDIFHLPISQHIDHDLCGQTKRVDKGLTIREHVDLPLGGHVILEHFLLLFGKVIHQRISSFHKVIQRLRILGVSLETALAGVDIAEVKIFQNQHLDAPQQ